MRDDLKFEICLGLWDLIFPPHLPGPVQPTPTRELQAPVSNRAHCHDVRQPAAASRRFPLIRGIFIGS